MIVIFNTMQIKIQMFGFSSMSVIVINYKIDSLISTYLQDKNQVD